MTKLFLFLPELTVAAAGFLFLCLMLAKNEKSPAYVRAFTVFAAAGVVLAANAALTASGTLFSGTYRVDLLSQGFKVLLAISFFFTAILSNRDESVDDSKRLEYGLFLSTATLGMMLFVSASDMMTLYVGMELSSYSLYLLAALRPGARNAESSVKYLLFGAAASGVFLWGLSILAGLSGSIFFVDIAGRLPLLAGQPIFMLAILLVLFAFLFKLSAFPLHFWAPDVYENAPTPVTNFIATASKAAAVALFARLFMLTGLSGTAVTVLGILAFISMTLGNAVALVQKDVKRLLAYSSIAQAGYLLVGFIAVSPEGYSSAFFYAVAYVIMNTAAFLVVSCVATASKNDNPQLSDFDGLADRSPLLALILLLGLLSLAGIPPLAGFTGKWILFSAAMDKGHWFLVLWAVLNSVVSLFYYLTLVKHAYLEKPKNPAPIALTTDLKLVALILFGALVFIGIYPDPLITFAQEAVAGAWIVP